MKIAFIVSKFPNLSETFILNQITGLLDRGYDIDIYANSHSNDPMIHKDIEKYDLLGHTFYYRDAIRKEIPANKFLYLLKTIGLIIAKFHKKQRHLLKPLKVVKLAAMLISYHQGMTFLDKSIHEHDIVHCHFGPNGSLGVLLRDIGAIKGKVVTSFYGYDISKHIETRVYYDHLFEMGDLFLALSDRMKSQLVRLGCREQRVVVHRLGIDTGKFLFHPRQLKEDGKVHLLTISRLVEKKGVNYGIQAVAKVLEDYPQIEYKIVGDGPLRSELQSLIDALNINDYVKLVGWKRQEEVIELLREGAILLAPSVTSEDGDEEGTPVALMEALAQGLPVLSTQHSGIPEVVQDGKSGFLVPERDIDALAERLEYLIKHPEIWPGMGKAGRDYVERHYDINKLNDQLVLLYQRLLDGELP